jgi:exodeoxyribonuclease V gamma subunit
MPIAPPVGYGHRRDEDSKVLLFIFVTGLERLYLGYVGRSTRDNAPLPPSVLIAELLDCLVPAIASDPASRAALDAARQRLVVEHPLQAFSIASFTADVEPRLRSFDAEYCEALKARLERAAEAPPRQRADAEPARAPVAGGDASAEADSDEGRVDEPELPFFVTPLAEPDAEWRHVTLVQLTRFFRNPVRYLLERRLGVGLAQADDELSDDEPFVPDWAGRRALARRLLPAYLDGADRARIMSLARAGTEYPSGPMGEHLLAYELRHFDAFAHALKRELAEPCLPPIEGALAFDLDGQAWRLTGAFGDLRRRGLVRHRYDDTRAGDYVAGWIAHLFVNAIAAPEGTRQTTWHSRDGRYVLPPINDAHAHLTTLLALYRRGLRAPLHFFPKSAWEYMTNGGSHARALSKWCGGTFPEGDDAAYRLALRGRGDPLDAEFHECAHTVLAPLLDCIEDPRL